MAPVVSMKELLEAGVHFGHQTRRWNPKMKRFIYGDRNGIYIIDLQQTLKRIETAYTFIRDLVGDQGSILFVGTKRQAQDPVQSFAEKCGMPYVNERWLGGMLTNFETMSKRVGKMQEYERMRESGEFDAMPKKEALLLSRELVKLERNLGGIRKMEKLPQAIFVLDTVKEHIAVTEANKLGIPIVAVVDTNCDPDVIQYVIPGNDDAIRAGTLMCRIMADAVDEGRFIASRRHGNGNGAGPAVVRSEAEEQAIAAQQAAARRQAALAQQQRDARLAGGTPQQGEAPSGVAHDAAPAAGAEATAAGVGGAPEVSTPEPPTESTNASPQPATGAATTGADPTAPGSSGGDATAAVVPAADPLPTAAAGATGVDATTAEDDATTDAGAADARTIAADVTVAEATVAEAPVADAPPADPSAPEPPAAAPADAPKE